MPPPNQGREIDGGIAGQKSTIERHVELVAHVNGLTASVPAALSIEQTRRRNGTATRAALIVAIVLGQIGFGILYSAVPPNPDQLELNYTAWRALHGEKQYVDFIAMNWPGAHWMHLAAIASFGNTLAAFRIVDYLIMIATLYAVAWLLRQAFGTATAVIALLAYPILFYGGAWLTGQRDFVAFHLTLIAACFHWKAWTTDRPAWQIGTGLAIAAATLIKPPFLLAGPLFVVHGLYMNWPLVPNWRRTIAQLAVLACSAAAGAVVAFGALLAEGTPFARFWEAAVEFHTTAYVDSKVPLKDLLAGIESWLFKSWWWITAFAVLSPLCFLGSRERRQGRPVQAYVLLVFLLGLSLVSVLWQAKGYMYHGAGLYVCLILFSFVTAGALWRFAQERRPAAKYLAAAGVLLFVVGTASRVRTFYFPPLRYATGRISADDYYRLYTVGGGMNYAQAQKFIAAIQKAAAIYPDADKKILVWSRANVINNLTGFPQATRFHHPPVLLIALPPFRLAAQWQQEFRDDLQKSMPFACVAATEFMTEDNDAVRFLQQFLKQNYHPAESTDGATLYLRNAPKS